MRVEHVHPPLTPRKPRDDARLDGGEVDDHQLVAGPRDEGRADELAERVRHVAEQHLERVVVPALQQRARKVQVAQLVLREVLHLHQPAGPAASAVGTVELGQPARAVVGAHAAQHGVVLRDTGLGQLLADLQHALHDHAVGGLKQARHRLFGEVGDRVVVHLLLQPRQQLVAAVGVAQSGELHRLRQQAIAHQRVALDGGLDQLAVKHDAAAVHAQVEVPQTPLDVGHLPAVQLLGDLALGLDVAGAVILEELPLAGVVPRQVAGPAMIRAGRLARQAEVADQLPAAELLVVVPQYLGHVSEISWQAEVERMHTCASPLLDRHLVAEVLRQAGDLEGGVVCGLDDARVLQRFVDSLGQRFALCQIDDLYRFVIERIAEEEHLEVVGLHVLVGAALLQVDGAVGLKVDP